MHDKSWDEFNSPRHHSEYNFEKFYVNDIELIGTELYVGYAAIRSTNHIETSSKGSPFLHYLHIPCEDTTKLIDYISNRQPSNICQFCGGAFKGILKKVCSVCGKPKDY